MTIIKRQIEITCAILLLLACNSVTKKPFEEASSKHKSIEGHYQWFDKSSICEVVKQEFDFNSDSSFLYHAFCHPHNFDPTGEKSKLKPYSMFGRWYATADPSIIKLIGYNGEVIKLEIQQGKIVNYYNENGERLPSGIFFQNPKK
jgi:hypothetical protein